MGICEKLLNIQSILKCNKSQYNSFGKYYYRNCEDILEAAKPICKQFGAVLTVTDEVVLIGDRFYIKATATLTDVDTGEKVSTTGYAREELEKKGMDGSQITGSASSYSRKAALNGLFCIDDTKDADTLNTGSQKATNNANTIPELEQMAKSSTLAELQALAKRKGVAPNQITARYKVNSLNDLTPAQVQSAMASLNKMADVNG
jgi:hypothetical protein